MIEIESERLLLRQWRLDDADEYATICADPEVMQHMTGEPYTRMIAWRHMAFLIGHWHLRGYGHWAVEEKATGHLVGRIGFLRPDDYPGFEVGWVLARSAWGKGYATEGAARALDHAFFALDQREVISLIRPDNLASIKVAQRLGEILQGEEDVGGILVQRYGMNRDTWQARRANFLVG
jgi:RimJ/RimL family protein N-acetyltransferase